MTAVLTFDDEFNSLSLWNGTTGTWDTGSGNGFSLTANGEQEWYINATYAPTASVQPWTVNNGIMTLTAAPASAAIQPLINGYQYTSGAITTSQSFSQTYGYFEMRAQLPAGQGLWPAFWLLPENGSWPPEIDVMEMLGNDPSVYYTSVHSGTAANEINAGQADAVPNTSTGYHTYGVDWEPDFITYYFDGQQVYKTATPSDMNVPMYMIANLAVGGYWPGNVDGTTPLPANMNIDFIRAYNALPTWIADGSDGTDVAHTAAGAVDSTGTGSGSGTNSGGGSTDTGTVPTADAAASYTVPDGVTAVVLTGTGAQTITANNLGDTITSTDYGSTIIGGTGNDTFIAGHSSDMLTGGAGSDIFKFDVLPWNAGHITDFTPGTDKLDLSGIFGSAGYTGTDPVADGYLSLSSDGAGDTLVYVKTPSSPWPTLITILDHVAPSSITPGDYGYGSSGTSSGGTSSGGSGSTEGMGGTGSTSVSTSAATYAVASGVTDVILTGTAAQTVTGNNLGDTITSNDFGSTLIGGTGNDTLIAGHGHDMLTGGGGNDTFTFNALPWNSGHVTDFNTATDKLDLTGILKAIGYTGSNPVADGYLSFVADGAGDTQVFVNAHDPSNPWSTLVTTLDHMTPASITTSDYVFGSSTTGSTDTGSADTGSTGGGETGTSSTPVSTSAAAYTVPSGVTDVTLTGTSAQTVTANNLGDTVHSNDFGSILIGGTGNDTLIAGPGHDMLTGGGGSDTFTFNALPWNAGHVTDFNTTADHLDLTGIFSTIGYTGTNPVADGYLSFVSDGAGDTQVIVNPHSAASPWPTLITTLDHVSPTSITAQDYVFGASGGTGSTGADSAGTSSTSVSTSAATYTVPSGVTNVVMTGAGAQTVTANDLGDTITTNDAASKIIGGAGNDTLIAGPGADTLTGGAGSDTFVFNNLPWNAGHITDFDTAGDVLNLTGIFKSIGYAGTNPVADGYLSFASDGAGDTRVFVNSHDPSNPWPTLITTLDHVAPSSITSHDWIFHA
jgi:serralysin